jgi:multimeric flavodoxin WrbA
MSFNILAISGSPRKKGNTEILVKAAIEAFTGSGHSVQQFFLSEKSVAPCIACEACSEDGICAVTDDAQEILENITSYNAVIVGSPVYFRNITAQLQSLFTRFHSIVHRHPFKDRICFGGAIAVGGSPNSQGITLGIIHNFFLSLGLICVPAKLNGVSVVAREKGEVLDQPESLNNARILGRNILNVLKMTNLHAVPGTTSHKTDLST